MCVKFYLIFLTQTPLSYVPFVYVHCLVSINKLQKYSYYSNIGYLLLVCWQVACPPCITYLCCHELVLFTYSYHFPNIKYTEISQIYCASAVWNILPYFIVTMKMLPPLRFYVSCSDYIVNKKRIKVRLLSEFLRQTVTNTWL